MAYNPGIAQTSTASGLKAPANLSGSHTYTSYAGVFLSLSALLLGHISIDRAEDKQFFTKGLSSAD